MTGQLHALRVLISVPTGKKIGRSQSRYELAWEDRNPAELRTSKKYENSNFTAIVPNFLLTGITKDYMFRLIAVNDKSILNITN